MAHNEPHLNIKSTASSSDVDSRYDTLTSIVPKQIFTPNPEQFKLERLCKVCRLNLKDSAIGIKNKKYRCKFCYQAVCENCSNQKVFHIILGKIQRICIACLNYAIEEKIKVQEKKQIEALIELNEDQKKVDNKTIESIKYQLSAKKQERLKKTEILLELNKKNEELIRQTSEFSVVIIENEGKIQIEKKLKVKELEEKMINEKIREINQDTSTISNEIVEAEGKIRELQMIKENMLKNKVNKEKLDNINVLINQIYSYQGIISTIKHDIINTKSKLNERLRKTESCTIV